ncbi:MULTISPECIES: Na+/H+ antiporter NhaA [Pseudomonas]|uniref:Na(+)/H(+) antiporter NhaA n=1 Tax=Pseudomonas plecoglossicida TaxID=70775 RepID=A0ABX4TVC3_PSEDL|nr:MULTISPECIES: Na+/H+ antiporter NhaA [Pseudomonas]MCO7535686.1 Na+/H+ antiporter NhaA [Pseudomonas asiatica]MCO7550021.1 Na+/H+ antiporter NhaA [Pseudomonas asiatica]MCO7561680.1 Na+/H+ antiporter NhaA [Pseudomonas asiatica]PLU85209.1 Na+/H+ antiporter NhaA [Pseudomonas plecoglossicida]PLU90661.1 Na+/H+ antiporter NhaA [Pseudomonas plecoglossicida]
MQKKELSRAQELAERAFANLERFLHIEAVSGIVLLVAAIAALIWANSPAAESYDALWHTPLTIGVGSLIYSQSLHFWINDGLMTIFFLVVGMEIRREIHEGALSSLRQAMLPMAAAIGGVAVPALFYLGFGHAAAEQQGWAVPTATDIAFAVGVLALLGKSIPSNVRVFLLALAIIDDIIAVLIIAFFYSGGLDYSGFGVALIGLLMVIGLQKIGVGSAYAYIIPGFVTWLGILLTGAHPTLAGVVLGLMTPVVAMPMRERPLDAISRFTGELLGRARAPERDASDLMDPLKRLRLAQRELVPPVVRMQGTLHPWVAFGIMPVFALANAGVNLSGVDLSAEAPQWVMIAVAVALVVGKPLGIVSVSWLMVRLGWCALPAEVSWRSITLVGLLAGIGFTMSIFIANLAFVDPGALGAAKLGVLSASVIAALLGLAWGAYSIRKASAMTKASSTP